jgi:dolichol kinase
MHRIEANMQRNLVDSEIQDETRLRKTDWHHAASGERWRIDVVASPSLFRRWGELPGTLSAKEIKRRLWHIAPGFLPIASYIYPHKDPLSPTFCAIAFGLIVGISSALLWKFKTIRRTCEQSELGAVFGYAVSTLLTLLLFPKHAELGMLVLCVLAFGDGMATTCGLMFLGPRLPWNHAKTWSGLTAFVVFGGLASSLAYWAESQPRAMTWQALVCGFSAASIASIAESLPSRINDNVRVGIVAAVTAVIAHAIVVGL